VKRASQLADTANRRRKRAAVTTLSIAAFPSSCFPQSVTRAAAVCQGEQLSNTESSVQAELPGNLSSSKRRVPATS
jgi:hypothetical protein